ncbi:MAG: DUF5011 domain-containing protein, partial [Bacteroidota bacterium]|nr:DUF5011 domain-containing protein [Bacteroidota bacterium]
GDFTYWYIPTVNPTSVKLTVTSCGGDSTFTKLVYIDQPTHAPTPDFEADILKPSVGADNVSFTDLSYICADSWEWIISPDSMVDQFNTTVPTYQFKGGTNETTKNPIIVFNKKDSFDITLIAGYNGFYDTLTKVDYIIAIEYCTPSISKNSQGKPNLNPDIGISRVQLAEINNTSQIGATEYSDYVNTSGTNLDLKGTYTLTVERNTAHNSMNRKAWIDWNIDGDFDDAGETIGYESDANSLQWNKTFQVPSTATKGATRMRIATSLGNMSNNACGINMFGEYEDYRIIVRKDGTPPEITIIGQETVTIEQCNCTYFDSGATAFDNISGVIAVSDTNNLDCTTPGQYWWRYSAVDAENNVAVKDRIIIVIADTTVPTIALIGALIDTLEVYNTFVEQGWTVDDTCSGVDRVDIIGTVDTSALGENILEYVVYDNMGNTATASRTVYVVDRTLPQISLNGYSLINHEVNNTFTDPGVTYNDNYCAHNDIIYEVTGTVDTETLGTYNLSYSVTDCNGNGPVIVTRTVNVVDTTAPVITSVNYFEGDTITIEVNSTFTMPSLTLTDNYDDAPAVNETGTLIDEFAPSMLLNKLGYYTYTVTASDGSMNSSTINFVVNIVDTEAPVITLVGASIINLCRFDTLASYNYNITDNFDVNPTVNVKGTYFDEYIPKRALGLYSITYDAFDQSNNVAVQVVRYVNIEECPWRSMEENGLESAVSLYPNPTKGKFVLDINLSVATDLNITITNTLGEVVKTMKLNNTKGGSYNVDISDRSSGMYFVRIQSGNNIVVKQVTLTK